MSAQELDLTHDQTTERELIEDEPMVELDLSGDAEGVEALVSELKETADSFNVTDFKCPNCGLPHGHDTDKHRAHDSFGLTAEEAANMEMNPNCHCGYNELAHRGRSDYGVKDAPSPESASSTAPIPQHIQRELRAA